MSSDLLSLPFIDRNHGCVSWHDQVRLRYSLFQRCRPASLLESDAWDSHAMNRERGVTTFGFVGGPLSSTASKDILRTLFRFTPGPRKCSIHLIHPWPECTDSVRTIWAVKISMSDRVSNKWYKTVSKKKTNFRTLRVPHRPSGRYQ